MPKINVTVFNRTTEPLVCSFNNSNGTAIAPGGSLPIGWPGSVGRWWVAIPPSSVPNQIVLTQDANGNVQVKSARKTLSYPIVNDAADIWIDVYPELDFWIRPAEIPFANYPADITIKAPLKGALPDLAAQAVDADFEVASQAARPAGHRVERYVDPQTQRKKIVVKNGTGEVDLCFKISADDGEKYRPMAMFVKRPNGNDPGWDAFDNYRIDGNTITVRDKFPPTKIGMSYKYYLVVQRESDSAICMIDPEIENSSSDS